MIFFFFFQNIEYHFLLLLEILDEAEFGEASTNLEYDETTLNPASELGLLVGNLITY